MALGLSSTVRNNMLNQVRDAIDDVNGTHPFVLVQNEGIIIENRVLNATSYGIAWYIDFSWAEVAAF